MKICASAWIYRWTTKLCGPSGRRAAGPWRAVGRGPLGRGPAFSKTRAISGLFVYKVIDMEYKIKYITTHVQFKILSSTFIPGSFGNVSRRGGKALSPHGEETLI